MVSRHGLRTIARLALAGFLLVQGAVAVAGCGSGGQSVALAIVSASMTDSHPCHQEPNDSTATLCAAHCVTQAQSLETPVWKAPAAAIAPPQVLVMPAQPAGVSAAPFELPFGLAGPPRRILYRTLLI